MVLKRSSYLLILKTSLFGRFPRRFVDTFGDLDALEVTFRADRSWGLCGSGFIAVGTSGTESGGMERIFDTTEHCVPLHDIHFVLKMKIFVFFSAPRFTLLWEL